MTTRTPILPGLAIPVHQVGGAGFRKQLQELTLSAKRAHSHIAPPEIIILRPRPEKEWSQLVAQFTRTSIGNAISYIAQLPPEQHPYAREALHYSSIQYSAGYVSAYFPEGADRPRNIVYIGQPLFNALNNPERRAVLAHEWGHHFVEAMEGSITNPTTEQQRISECKSDHWARFHSDPAALVSGILKTTALQRAHSGDDLPVSETHPDNTHPMLNNRFMRLLKPRQHRESTDAPFDGQCNLPPQPSAPRKR